MEISDPESILKIQDLPFTLPSNSKDFKLRRTLPTRKFEELIKELSLLGACSSDVKLAPESLT